MISSPEDVYTFARRLRESCKASGHKEAAVQLDDALHMGSSALETLGAIRNSLLMNQELYQNLASQEELQAAIEYVNHVFGRG
jgi:anti-anti-sigma regulatory factor